MMGRARPLARPPVMAHWSPRKIWRRFWERAPRQLATTRQGKVVLFLALAVGAAAINTGNNLLLLGWGLVLSAIVISGLLSEATLKPLGLTATVPLEARVEQATAIALTLVNSANRVPAFGVEAAVVVVDGTDSRSRASAPYLLRIEPHSEQEIFARWTPTTRGLHTIDHLVAVTQYPFGFFQKSRRFSSHSKGNGTSKKTQGPVHFWAFPKRVPVKHLLSSIAAQLGESPSNRVGPGEDFFSLRPYRQGDDLRRIHWRRSARAGRWYVGETEANTGSRLVLELALPGEIAEQQQDLLEITIATAGSLAEVLLEQGYQVGLRAPGIYIEANAGPRQRRGLLLALAQLEVGAGLPPLPAGFNAPRVAIAGRSGWVSAEADVVLPVVL